MTTMFTLLKGSIQLLSIACVLLCLPSCARKRKNIFVFHSLAQAQLTHVKSLVLPSVEPKINVVDQLPMLVWQPLGFDSVSWAAEHPNNYTLTFKGYNVYRVFDDSFMQAEPCNQELLTDCLWTIPQDVQAALYLVRPVFDSGGVAVVYGPYSRVVRQSAP